MTALHLGVKYGHVECVEYLLSIKANANCYDDGVSAIVDAVKMRRRNIVSLLKSYGEKMECASFGEYEIE